MFNVKRLTVNVTRYTGVAPLRRDFTKLAAGAAKNLGVATVTVGIFLLGAVGCGAQEGSHGGAARQLETEFVEVAKKVSPAVGSISTEITQRLRIHRQRLPGFEGDIFDQFFRDFLGESPEHEFKQQGLGTGVIIDPSGLLLTNEHVIHGADKVTVTLPDGREFRGVIKGSDLRSDLAIIKIQAKNLPSVELGDSDQVKIGQWAIAVGNPFGWAVGGTEPAVTVGVISALNRSIRIGGAERDYSNMIQTDAAINPGNSGGPLVNLDGKIIGINVAIFSTTGGYQGVGFAIPSNAARRIMKDLIAGKAIQYGWLGVNVQDVTEELAKYFDLKATEGVIVAGVLADSPAEKGGLKDGDVIVTYDGEPLKNVRELLNRVNQTPVGKRIPLGVIREKKPVNVTMEIGQRPSESAVQQVQAQGNWRGLRVGSVTPELAERLSIEPGRGVVITDVEPGSPADESGLRVGDLILEINRQSIGSIDDFKGLSRRTTGDVLIKTTRGYAILKEEE